MNRMKVCLGALLAVVSLGGCDPYEESGDLPGAPRVVRAGVFHSESESVFADPDANGAVVLNDIDVLTDPVPDDPTVDGDQSEPAAPRLNAIQIQFSAMLDGASIQAAPPNQATGSTGDCTPVGLTVTPAAPPPLKWYTCYSPSSAADDARGSVLVFRTFDMTQPNLPEDADPDDLTAATLDPNVQYRITGSVRSGGGTTIPVDVTVNTVDLAGDP